MPIIISPADLGQFLEGSLGFAAAVAQDTVRLPLPHLRVGGRS
jgi:hypothetical protein